MICRYEDGRTNSYGGDESFGGEMRKDSKHRAEIKIFFRLSIIQLFLVPPTVRERRLTEARHAAASL